MAEPLNSRQLLERIRCNAGATQIFADFLRERLSESRIAFTKQTRDTFDVHKGRCLELEAIIQDLIK